MTDRIPSVPPPIKPVACPEAGRPLWSVMIPVYNCTGFLEEALRSVLEQDPGEALMQIEVVDDCSTDADVAALVEAVAKGRVKYFRQERNRGSLRNFETCINRSRGQWVHILHGDDRVEPGYYQEIESLFAAHPQAGAAFTNNRFISRAGESLYVKKQLLKEAGIIEDFLLRIAKWQLLEPAAIVVKRSVYEQLGSFYAVHYGEDWEMWTRIAAHYPVAYSPKCLASYRVLNDGNITQQSYLTGQNVRDIIQVIDIIQSYLPHDKKRKLKEAALNYYSIHCARTANKLYPKQASAAFIQAREAWKINKNLKSIYFLMRFLLKYLYTGSSYTFAKVMR